VLARLHIPSLGGASDWLNSEPLGPAELRGNVALVSFLSWFKPQISRLPPIQA
jgi:hypothetical protein